MGEVIGGRYEVGDLLGTGGMGAVYRGIDKHTGEPVALKLLKPEIVASDMLARFAREGEALRQLNHPNIVKVLSTVQDGDNHYIVMELVGGGSLDNLLKTSDESRLPINRVLRIALELADALTRAHHLNIIHRDIKPANVLIADDGTPRLTDFGIAFMGERERITKTDSIVGTLDYLSPEAFSGDGIDSRSDIWAFGVMLFEMLTGQRPFDRPSTSQTLMAILNEPPPDLESLRSDAPVSLIDLIYRMLEKDRSQRIPSVRLVGAELEAILQGRDSTPSNPRTSPLSTKWGGDLGEGIFDTPTPPIGILKNNLPAQTTPFVGREEELAELTKLIADPNTRLVTILASGGMGKTRLALEVGTRYITSNLFANGVYLIPLAPLTSPDFIVSTIAESVGFQFYQGGEPKQQLLDYFREKSMLLIIDNFEHVLSGAGIVSEILQAAPSVKILATSRERLNLSGETLFSLSGMDFPEWETPEDALNYSAVKLFMQSARRVRPDFELKADDLTYVARICRMVQGLPLGIVLAAAWVEMLSPREIADEISQSLDFLETEMRDVPERHRSIRAVFDYSWNLLTDDERAVFAKLSVFRGGFTREAAQAVADASLRNLTALVNKSLLRRNPDTGRYEIHELLRQYAENKLHESAPDAEQTQNLHSNYYTEFMYLRENLLKGTQRQAILTEIETDLDNVRSAWNWALQNKQFEQLNRAIECLYQFYDGRGLFVDAEKIFHASIETLERSQQPVSTVWASLFGKILSRYGKLCVDLGKVEQAQELLNRSLTYIDENSDGSSYAFVLMELGRIFAFTGKPQTAIESAEKGVALYRKTNDVGGLANALILIANGLIWLGNFEAARDCLAEIMSVQKFYEANTLIFSRTLNLLAHITSIQGNFIEAERLLRESLALVEKTGNIWDRIETLFPLATVLRNQGNYAEAEACGLEMLKLSQEAGQRFSEAGAILILGDLVKEQGRYDEAQVYYMRGLSLTEAISDVRQMALAKLNLGDIASVHRKTDEAKRYLLDSLQGFESLQLHWGMTLALDNLGYAAYLEGDFDTANQYFKQAFNMAMGDKLIPFATNIIAGIARLLAQTGQPTRAVELLALIQTHKATERHTHVRRIEPILAELKASLSPDEFAAAYERGKSLDLETITKELLAD